MKGYSNTVVCLKSGLQKSGLLRFCEKVLIRKIRTFIFSPNKPCPKYPDFYDLTEVIFKKIQTLEKHSLCFRHKSLFSGRMCTIPI